MSIFDEPTHAYEHHLRMAADRAIAHALRSKPFTQTPQSVVLEAVRRLTDPGKVFSAAQWSNRFDSAASLLLRLSAWLRRGTRP